MNTIFTISGLPGSGTTTAAKLLAKKTNMKLISSGEIFRALADKKGVSLEEFSKLAEENKSIDIELDKGLLEKASPGCILEGRLTGHILFREGIESFKVWLEASKELRVKRIANREDEKEKVIYDKTVKREKSEYQRYKKYYDIDLNDKSIYDLVIDSGENDPEEIVDKIIKGVEDGACEGKGLHVL